VKIKVLLLFVALLAATVCLILLGTDVYTRNFSCGSYLFPETGSDGRALQACAESLNSRWVLSLVVGAVGAFAIVGVIVREHLFED